MLIFLFLLSLLPLSSSLFSSQLQDINHQIFYLQQLDYILTQRRHSLYNYSNINLDSPIPINPYPITNQSNITYPNIFTQSLSLQSSHPSGLRSFILFLKYNLYNAECFHNNTKIYYLNGTLVLEIEGEIMEVTIVKATIEYQICYLERSLRARCGVFEENLKNIKWKEVKLEPQTELKLELISRYHVQKFEGNNLHTLLLSNGEIRVYDGAGIQKPPLLTSCHSVVKYLDHNPYPMIIGTDKIAFLEPFKPSETSLGCPVIEGEIITAEVETPFSNTFYLLTRTEIIVMQYSLKKSDRHCKVSHRIPISSPSYNFKMFYPTLLFNNSYINITDGLSPPQLPLPLSLCSDNTYQTQYRNNEYYLLHRCCNNTQCVSSIYMKSKKVNVTTNKHFKYVVFLIIFAIVAVKFWNRKENQERSGGGEEMGREEQDVDMDPMVKYQQRIFKQKLKKAKNM